MEDETSLYFLCSALEDLGVLDGVIGDAYWFCDMGTLECAAETIRDIVRDFLKFDWILYELRLFGGDTRFGSNLLYIGDNSGHSESFVERLYEASVNSTP